LRTEEALFGARTAPMRPTRWFRLATRVCGFGREDRRVEGVGIGEKHKTYKVYTGTVGS